MQAMPTIAMSSGAGGGVPVSAAVEPEPTAAPLGEEQLGAAPPVTSRVQVGDRGDRRSRSTRPGRP
jgi:hypothetical protein